MTVSGVNEFRDAPGQFKHAHTLRSLAWPGREEPAVPVSYVELSEAEEALVLASLDPLAGMAVTDQAKLAELLEEATVSDGGLREHLQATGGCGSSCSTSPRPRGSGCGR